MRGSGKNNGKRENDSYTPLLNDAEEHKGEVVEDHLPKQSLFKKNPYEDSFFISKLFFSWVTPLARVRHEITILQKLEMYLFEYSCLYF